MGIRPDLVREMAGEAGFDLVRFGRFPYSAGRLTIQDHAVVEQALDYVDMTAMRDCFLDELCGEREPSFAKKLPNLRSNSPSDCCASR